MRKMIGLFLLVTLFFCACSQKNTPGIHQSTPAPAGTSLIESVSPKTSTGQDSKRSSPKAALLKVSDYFPFTKDVYKKFRGSGMEYAELETYVDYVNDKTMQERRINGGTTLSLVYRITDNALQAVYRREEAYYRYDYTSFMDTAEDLIKEPIAVGTTWKSRGGDTASITAIDKRVKTPAGEFDALEITIKGDHSTVMHYYAKELGYIKTEFLSENSAQPIVTELEKVEKGKPFTHKVRFYYPDSLKGGLVYIDKSIDIYTNEDMKFQFQKELKTVPEQSELAKVLSPNVRVLSCKPEQKNGTVTVDFSSHLVSEMHAGSYLEGTIIKSLVNTFGDYYQKDKVIITIEGKPYESGHFMMKPGEYFTVEKDNVLPYN